MAEQLVAGAKWWSYSSYTYGEISTAYSHWRSGTTQYYKIDWACKVSSGAIYGYGLNIYVQLDGVRYLLGTVPQTSASGWYYEGSTTYSFTKTSGTTSAIFEIFRASDGTGLWNNGSYFSLAVDPAYPSCTTNPSVKSKTETSITFDIGGWNIASDIYYSTDNSNWTHATSQSVTKTGLTANTSYTIYVQARNQADNSLRTTVTTSATTYNYPYVTSAPSFTIGNSNTISIYNPLKRSVKFYMIGANSSEKGGDTTTETSISGYNNDSWKTWWYSTIPNATSGTYKVRLERGSYGGNTTTTGGTYKVIGTEKPTFSNWTYEDTDSTILALTGDNQKIVKGYSKLKAIISTDNKASANYSASMSKYRLTIGSTSSSDVSYSSSEEVSTSVVTATQNTAVVYAIDSRGLSTGVTKTISDYLNYGNISITSLSVARTDNVGTETTLSATINMWNNSFGTVSNSIKSLYYEYKLASSSDWITGTTELTYTTSGNTVTIETHINGDLDGTDGFDANNVYDIRLVVSDELSSATSSVSMGAGNPAIAIFNNKVSIGGKYNEDRTDTLQVNGNTYVIGNHVTSGTEISTASRTKLETLDGRITNANITHTYENDKAHMQLLIATTDMTSNKPSCDGYILHFSWDNSLAYDSQLYIVNNDVNQPLQFRGCNNGTWGSWENLYRGKVLYNNAAGSSGSVTLSESIANFTFIEIFWLHNRDGIYIHNSTRVYNNGASRYFGLVDITGYSSNFNHQLGAYRTSYMSGTTISNTRYGKFEWTAGSCVGSSDEDAFLITRVVGYR